VFLWAIADLFLPSLLDGPFLSVFQSIYPQGIGMKRPVIGHFLPECSKYMSFLP
jgi:hypothetical protein